MDVLSHHPLFLDEETIEHGMRSSTTKMDGYEALGQSDRGISLEGCLFTADTEPPDQSRPRGADLGLAAR